MKGNFKRLRFRGRIFSQSELNCIRLFGTEEAWLKYAERTSDPERWRNVLKELRPWAGTKPNLCDVLDGEIVLIGQIFIRVPDAINQLNEPKVVRIIRNPRLNPLTAKTEWIYITGNQPAYKIKVAFPAKRGYGQPRKKAIPF